MKILFIALLTIYQRFVSPLLHQALGMKSACRHYPTCSEYAKEAVIQHGVGKGLVLATRRFLNCQPFFSI